MVSAALQEISFYPMATRLDDLAQAVALRIDREHRAGIEDYHRGLPAFLKFNVRTGAATFRAIRYLTLDRQAGHGPAPALATSVPPLARTLLEALMGIVFLYDDPAVNTEQYYRSGWRDAYEIHQRLVGRYGSDPRSRDYLTGHSAWVASHEADCRITAANRADPSTVSRFPNPGKMTGRTRKDGERTKSEKRRAFLMYLNDWFYGELSQDAHMTYMGLARRGSMLDDQNSLQVEAYRS
ncbi:MAG TPA: hypothetical protein VER33_27815 [Polyangiaceae bacterium]|nr:hypothetical protein [Polyangiaceae bacterium]